MEELEFREGFAGACYVNGRGICVAQPEDFCDEGTFASAHFMRARVGDITHPLRFCAGDLGNVFIGRCGDSGECSNLASRCDNSTTFDEFVMDCTVTRDLRNGTHVTYGKCGERCVWSPDDCLEGEGYVSNDPECTADRVQIGACFAGHAFCAVGPKSCTQPGLPDEPFWSHQKVQELVGANCMLAHLPEPPQPTATPASPAPSASRPETEPPTQSPIEIVIPSSNGPRLSENALIGIVAAVSVMVGIAIGAGAAYCRRRRERAEAASWRVDAWRNSSIILGVDKFEHRDTDDTVPTGVVHMGVVETGRQVDMDDAESAMTDPDFEGAIPEGN